MIYSIRSVVLSLIKKYNYYTYTTITESYIIFKNGGIRNWILES